MGCGGRTPQTRRTGAARAIIKGLCAILILAPMLGGCGDKKEDLAACRIEAVRAHPDAKNDRESLNAYSKFVTACLRAKGYTVDAAGRVMRGRGETYERSDGCVNE